MEHIIIGSRLFIDLFPNNVRIQERVRDTTDWDVLIDHEPTLKDKKFFKTRYGSKTELHYTPILWDVMYPLMMKNKWEELKNVYFTLKCSHLPFHKVHKKKTFYDIYLMSQAGCTVQEDLFFKLYEHWVSKFGEPWRADFTKESSEFFDDAVSRENVHDQLHEAVAMYEKPAFRYVQYPDQTTVWVCPELWKKVGKDIRFRVVVEEAQTLALERNILDKLKRGVQYYDQQRYYITFIEGLIDRLAPLWMVPYICNRFYDFVQYKEDFTSKYLNYKKTTTTMLKFETDYELGNLIRSLDGTEIINQYDLDQVGSSNTHPVLGNINVVASTYSNECEYDGYSTIDSYRVLHLMDVDKYVRCDGGYSSYDGFTVHSMRLVTPTEKTIIVYE